MQSERGTTGNHFVDFYQDACGAFEQEHRCAGSMPLHMIRASQDTHEIRDVTMDNIVIATVLTSGIVGAEVDYGDGVKPLSGASGKTGLITPYTDPLYRVEGPHVMLGAVLPGAHVRKLLDEAGGPALSALDAIAFQEFADRAVVATLHELWRHSRAGGTAVSLLVDGLVLTLLGQLLLRAQAPLQRDTHTSLDEARLRRVLDLMEAELGSSLTTERLAGEAGISTYHFSRAFKRATGDTPHRTLTRLRVERAARMIEAGVPLSDIAYACGFSSQPHFTSTFAKYMGLPPKAWLDAARG